MKERVMGIENEMGFLVSDAEGCFPEDPFYCENDVGALGRALWGLDKKHGVLSEFGEQTKRLWLSNGGCLYIDLRNLEWASPECRRARDVVLYNKVGERAANVFFEGNGKHVFHFFKTTIAPDRNAENDIDERWPKRYVTLGCHENYMTYATQHLPAVGAESYIPLVPFLITRQVYDGSGWWLKNGADTWNLLRPCDKAS